MEGQGWACCGKAAPNSSGFSPSTSPDGVAMPLIKSSLGPTDLSLSPRLGQRYPPLSSFVGVSEGCYLESDGGSLAKLGYIEAPVSSGRTAPEKGLGDTPHLCVSSFCWHWVLNLGPSLS